MSCCFIFSFNVFSILSFYVISIFLAQQHNLKCSLIDTQNEGIDVMRTNSYLHHASSVYDILLFYADKHISMSFKINLRLKLLGFYVSYIERGKCRRSKVAGKNSIVLLRPRDVSRHRYLSNSMKNSRDLNSITFLTIHAGRSKVLIPTKQSPKQSFSIHAGRSPTD